MAGVDRNKPCPCGSGKKYKRCCAGKAESTRYTQQERDVALAILSELADDTDWEDVVAAVDDEMWGTVHDDEHPELGLVSDRFADWYMFFDYELDDDGLRMADLVLETDEITLPPGVLRYLRLARESVVRLYEATEVRAGVGLTLRNVLTGELTRVQERTASREIPPGAVLAVRVLPSGSGGEPVFDGEILPFLPQFRGRLMNHLRELAEEYEREIGPVDDAFFEDVTPLLHQYWVAQRNPPSLAFVVSRFNVTDTSAVSRALDADGSFERHAPDAPRWLWRGGETASGLVELTDDTLNLLTQFEAQAEQARTKLEAIAGTALSFRSIEHQDPKDVVPEPGSSVPLPKELRAVIQQKLDEHYRAWLDEPIPRLDGQTPRDAVKSDRLRPRVRDMLVELEQMYAQARETGEPAHDPAWMWQELQLQR